MRRALGAQSGGRQVAADELQVEPDAIGCGFKLWSEVARGVEIRGDQQHPARQLAVFGGELRQRAEEVVGEAAWGGENAHLASTREATPQLVFDSPFEDREPVAHRAVQRIAVKSTLRERRARGLIVDVPHHTSRIAVLEERTS